jgi:hypothetical protein
MSFLFSSSYNVPTKISLASTGQRSRFVIQGVFINKSSCGYWRHGNYIYIFLDTWGISQVCSIHNNCIWIGPFRYIVFTIRLYVASKKGQKHVEKMATDSFVSYQRYSYIKCWGYVDSNDRCNNVRRISFRGLFLKNLNLRSRIFLERQAVTRSKNSTSFMEPQRFIIVFITAFHWTLFWTNWIQPTTSRPTYFRFTLKLPFHAHLLVFLSGFPIKLLYVYLICPCVLYDPSISSSLMWSP